MSNKGIDNVNVMAHPANVTAKYFDSNLVDGTPGVYPEEKRLRVTGYGTTATGQPVAILVDDDGKMVISGQISIGNLDINIEADAADGDSFGMYTFVDGNVSNPIPTHGLPDGTIRMVERVNLAATDTIVSVPETGIILNVLGNNILAENLARRAQVIFQPRSGNIEWGFSSYSFLSVKNQMAGAALGPGLSLKVRGVGKAVDVAIGELA